MVKHRQLIDYVDGFVVDPWSDEQVKEKDAYFNPAVSMDSVNVEMPNGKVREDNHLYDV